MFIDFYSHRLTREQIICVQDICTSASFSEALEKYIVNSSLIPTVSFVKCNPGQDGIGLYEPFSKIPNIDDYLHTPFEDGKVNFVNRRSFSRWAATGDAAVFTERCVSFDTQTVSYLHRYCQGNKSALPSSFFSVIQVMRLGDIGVDYIPYTTENLLFTSERREIVLDTLTSFERMFYDGKKSERACRKYAKRVLRLYDQNISHRESQLKEMWEKLYVVLMEMIKIQITMPAQSVNKKMQQLCNFMDESLGIMMYPELILAKRYFTEGQKLSFFGKIQRRRTDILKVIQNMTWDLFHLRMLEVGCMALTSPHADFFVPYLFTFDKRLRQIKNCYALDALAVNTKGLERFPFYAHMNEIFLFTQEVSTLERYERRRELNLKMDFPKFVEACERRLCDTM